MGYVSPYSSSQELQGLSRCEGREGRGPWADSEADVTAVILCEYAKPCKFQGEICSCSQTRRKPQSTDRHTPWSQCNLSTGCYMYTVPICDRIACVSNISTCLWTNTPSQCIRICWKLLYSQTGFHLFLYAALFTQQHLRGARAAESAQCVTIIYVDSIIWAVLCSPDGDWLLMCTEPVGVNAALSSASASAAYRSDTYMLW